MSSFERAPTVWVGEGTSVAVSVGVTVEVGVAVKAVGDGVAAVGVAAVAVGDGVTAIAEGVATVGDGVDAVGDGLDVVTALAAVGDGVDVAVADPPFRSAEGEGVTVADPAPGVRLAIALVEPLVPVADGFGAPSSAARACLSLPSLAPEANRAATMTRAMSNSDDQVPLADL